MSEIKFECEKCDAELEAALGDACITIYPCQHCLKEAEDSGFNNGLDDGQAQGYDSGYEEGKQAGLEEASSSQKEGSS